MTTAIVDHLWQSTLFVVVAWLLTLALRNNAARVRYWVWLAASIKFLIPFSLLTALGGQFSWQSAVSGKANNVFIVAVQQLAEPLGTPEIVLRSPHAQVFDFLPIVIAIWILGCALLLVRWGVSWFRIVAVVRRAAPIAIQSPIAVKSTSSMSEPGVVGVLRPVLLLPEGIAARLNGAQMQAILAHELCHVRRRDNLTAAIHMIVEVLFWFHPLVWWIGAQLVAERERACDESVVDLGNEPQAYAEGILKVCQFYLESKLTCVAGVSGANIKKRVEAIMSNSRSIDLSVVKRAVLASATVLSIASPIVIGVMTTTSANSPFAAASNPGIDNLRLEVFESDSAKPKQFRDGLELLHPHETVRAMIAPPYQVQRKQIIGAPAWIDTSFYDTYITGTDLAPEGIERLNQYALLERRMLVDRFGLQFHREMQWVSVYVLSVSDQGRNANLQEVTPADTGRPFKQSVSPGGVEAFPRLMTAAPMHHFAATLSRILNSIVLDRTGLIGAYRFELPQEPTPESLPSMLQSQFGLKLERRTEQVEMFVIDAIQAPTTQSQTRTTKSETQESAVREGDGRRDIALRQRMDPVNAHRELSRRNQSQQSTAVATVRPTPGTTRTAMGGGQIVEHTEDAFTASNTTLKELITIAYGGAPGRIVGGPPWMETARFDVTFKLLPAKQLPDIPEKFRGTRMESYQGMRVQLQQLLAERFNLVLRRDSNVVYTLTTATDGVKLQSSNASVLDWRGVRDSGEALVGQGASVQDLITSLSARLSRPVLNRTTLSETYDFQLQLPARVGSLDAQKLSDALTEQLGLSLGSLAIPTLVIERATKPGEVI